MEPYYSLDGRIAVASEHCAGPWDPTMQHGGAPTGLITRIAEDIPTKVPMRITRLTVDLKRPVPLGELEVDVVVTREGRNIQTADITLSANGKEVTKASVLKIRSATFDMPDGAVLPVRDNKLPNEWPDTLADTGFASAVRLTPTQPLPPGTANALWFHIERPFFADRETTSLMRAAATGDFCNAFGTDALDYSVWTYLNADLTIHFAREPVGDWMMLAANSLIGPDGRAIAHGELSDELGVFGRATQSLVLNRR